MGKQESDAPQVPSDVEFREQSSVMNKLEWTEHQTTVVVTFLSGEDLQTSSSHDLWVNLAEETDIRDTKDLPPLLAASEEITAKYIPPTLLTPPTNDKEFEYIAKESADVVLQVAVGALRKSEVWGVDEHRYAATGSSVREAGKTGFSEDEITVNPSGTRAEDGGPNLRSVIKIPSTTSDKSLMRIRTSLAHGVAHNLRALTNRQLWLGLERDAQEAGLSTPEGGRRQEVIGGFRVGSNKLGSEAVGMLFEAHIGFLVENGSEPTLSDITPIIAEKIRSEKMKVENRLKTNSEKVPITSRYLSANVALIDHIEDLENHGLGNTAAIDLVALGCYGYGSFEKLPAMIELGLVSQDDFGKMKEVVRNVSLWLTSDDENGFKLN